MITEFLIQLNSFIEQEGKTISLNKGDFLIREGEIETHLYYIQSGAVRAFYQSEHQDYTIRFGYEGNIINSLASFISHQPSELFIAALKKTKVKAISKAQLQNFIHSSTQHLEAYSQLIEQLVVQQIEREIDLLIESPTERLNRVLKRSPLLFQHIPLKYIASYLRMSAETLSRIKR